MDGSTKEHLLRVRFELGFNGAIVLYGFLPETENVGLHLSYGGGRYSIAAYMSDRSRQLESTGNVPTSFEDPRKHPALMCKGLTLEIQDAMPETNLLKSLETGEWTEETRGYVAEMIELAYDVHNGIIEYFRNLGQQSWLEPTSPDGVNAQKNVQFVLDELSARWLDSKGRWQRLTVAQRSLMMQFRNHFMDGVDIDEWRNVETFVEAFLNSGRRASVIDVLIANSLGHLNQQNARLAVIEAVIALEGMVVRDHLSKVIVGLNNPSQLDSDLIDELIQKSGLRLSVKVILKANADRLGIDEEDIVRVLEAIEVRNRIIHQRQRQVEFEKAKEYVFAIRKVIARLRGKSVFRRAQGEISVDFR